MANFLLLGREMGNFSYPEQLVRGSMDRSYGSCATCRQGRRFQPTVSHSASRAREATSWTSVNINSAANGICYEMATLVGRRTDLSGPLTRASLVWNLRTLFVPTGTRISRMQSSRGLSLPLWTKIAATYWRSRLLSVYTHGSPRSLIHSWPRRQNGKHPAAF